MRLRTALAATLLFPACAPTVSPAPAADAPAHVRKDPPGPIHHVLLITLDGLLPDSYEHPDARGLKIPTLRSIVAHGASSDGALSVFPSVTYPSHTSMTTGVFPGAHGINGNRAFDPLENDLEGWNWYAEDIKRDPIWRIAERAGYPTALVHWPVSVGAKVTWLVPEYWRAKDDNDRKLVRALATPGLLESVAAEHPDFWPRYAPPDVKDDALTDIALHILATGKPTLLQLHLVQVDGAQHHYGIWSPEALAAIEHDDRQLARIFELLDRSGLAKDTSVIVASDHGFMNAEKMVRPGVLLREAGLVMMSARSGDAPAHVTDWRATLVVNSGEAYVYVKDPADTATRETVRKILTAKVGQEGSGIGRVFDSAEVRAKGGDPEAFLAIEAAPGYQLGPGYAGEYVGAAIYHATHGYDPDRPEMHASLLMIGPNVPHGALASARLVDIAPTIAEWLGLAMGSVDGKPLRVTPAP
jgi:predicted AlkP superfamily pyrophosphatase or phosphodiesterase